MKKVKVKVPATIGNLGPGFDVLGMALDLNTVIEISIDMFSGVNKTKLIVAEKNSTVPTDKKNMIWLAAYEVFKKLGKFPRDCTIKSDNSIPLARGLGSSAAARVGGLLAADALCGNRLDEQWILNTAARLEGHPDNVTPALKGGIVISTVYKKEKVVFEKIGNGRKLKVVLCIPDFEVSTDRARKVFTETIDRLEVLRNSSYFTSCTIAYRSGNYDILDEGTKDFLHQPYRKKLIPEMDNVFKAAIKAGAYGAVLSGSGSTIAALCPYNMAGSKRIGSAMVEVFKQAGKKSEYKVAEVSKAGAHVIN